MRDEFSLLAPVHTILPDAKMSAVVLGSRMRMITAAKRCGATPEGTTHVMSGECSPHKPQQALPNFDLACCPDGTSLPPLVGDAVELAGAASPSYGEPRPAALWVVGPGVGAGVGV